MNAKLWMAAAAVALAGCTANGVSGQAGAELTDDSGVGARGLISHRHAEVPNGQVRGAAGKSTDQVAPPDLQARLAIGLSGQHWQAVQQPQQSAGTGGSGEAGQEKAAKPAPKR